MKISIYQMLTNPTKFMDKEQKGLFEQIISQSITAEIVVVFDAYTYHRTQLHGKYFHSWLRKIQSHEQPWKWGPVRVKQYSLFVSLPDPL